MSIYDLQYGRTDVPGGGLLSVPKTFDIFRRLLAPEEFDELGPGQKMIFDSYMDYVKAYQNQEKRASKYGTPGTQRIPQGGSWSVAGAGTPIPISTTSNRQATTTAKGDKGDKGESAIPSYRTKTDITGKVSFEPIGGRRTMEGEYIPTSLEEVQSAEELKYAVPKIQTESELDFVLKEAALAQAKASALTPKAVLEERRVATGEKRAATAEQAREDVNTRFKGAQTFKQANMVQADELHKSRIKLTSNLNKERDKLKADEREALEKVKFDYSTEEDIAKSQRALTNAKALLEMRIEATNDENEKNRKARFVTELSKLEVVLDKNMQTFEYRHERSKALKGVSPARMAQAEEEYDKSEIGKKTWRLVQGIENTQAQMGNLDNFISAFTKDQGRAPSPDEISKAQGKYWK